MVTTLLLAKHYGYRLISKQSDRWSLLSGWRLTYGQGNCPGVDTVEFGEDAALSRACTVVQTGGKMTTGHAVLAWISATFLRQFRNEARDFLLHWFAILRKRLSPEPRIKGA